MVESIYSYGLLALELCPGHTMRQCTLSVAQIEQLGAHIADDLRTWIGAEPGIHISIAGAAFDSVEILRPGWPIHQELARLTHLAPQSTTARIVCFGAQTQHMPEGLQPDPQYQQGPLRLIPYLLSGPASVIQAVQERMEAELMERGMAGANTALCAQELFDIAIEHARYMTLHDCVAMMAMQYQHHGLAPIWPIIETALFAPQHEFLVDAAPEPLVFFKNNTAHIALLDCHQWAQLQNHREHRTPEQFEAQFQQFQMRQRQIAALLEAHGVTVSFDFCAEAKTALSVLKN